MKGVAVQLIASSVALALMAGGGGFHWWKVKGLEEGASGPDWTALNEAPSTGGWAMLTSIGPGESGADEKPMPTRDEMNKTLEALEGVVDVLRDLKQENASLRNQNEDLLEQVMEVNRDVNELQLRADMVSESFRPLKAKQNSGGIMPSPHPLLPPKPKRGEPGFPGPPPTP